MRPSISIALAAAACLLALPQPLVGQRAEERTGRVPLETITFTTDNITVPGFDTSLGELVQVRLSHTQTVFADFRGERVVPDGPAWTVSHWFSHTFSTPYTPSGQSEVLHEHHSSFDYTLEPADEVPCGGADSYQFTVPDSKLGFSIHLASDHPRFADFLGVGIIELTEDPGMGWSSAPGTEGLAYCGGTPTVELTRRSRVTYVYRPQ